MKRSNRNYLQEQNQNQFSPSYSFFPFPHFSSQISLAIGVNNAINAPPPPKCAAFAPNPAYKLPTPFSLIISLATGKKEAGIFWTRLRFITTERTVSPGVLRIAPVTPAAKPEVRLLKRVVYELDV